MSDGTIAWKKVFLESQYIDYDTARAQAKMQGLKFRSEVRYVKAFNLKIQVRVCCAWNREGT